MLNRKLDMLDRSARKVLFEWYEGDPRIKEAANVEKGLNKIHALWEAFYYNIEGRYRYLFHLSPKERIYCEQLHYSVGEVRKWFYKRRDGTWILIQPKLKN